ncbi:hypothetical protein [Sphaerothrix gracilis]|uniref:hypothetical protein n=1 Tax=Sphaerothrix gracilis TaxID=3151835 RepID=UPI0031FDF73F
MDWNIIWVSVFGTVFFVSSILLAIKFPNPTPYQLFVFRTVFALSAAGVGATIPGFLSITTDFAGIVIRAGGAIALFILVYSFNPAQLIESSNKDYSSSSSHRFIPDNSKQPFRISISGMDNKITLVYGNVPVSSRFISISGMDSSKTLTVPYGSFIVLNLSGVGNQIYANRLIYENLQVQDSGQKNKVIRT